MIPTYIYEKQIPKLDSVPSCCSLVFHALGLAQGMAAARGGRAGDALDTDEKVQTRQGEKCNRVGFVPCNSIVGYGIFVVSLLAY